VLDCALGGIRRAAGFVSWVREDADLPEPFAGAELTQLLEAIAGRDEAAMAAFYDLTCGKVFALAMHILKDNGLAEEVVLDTYWQAWQEADRYQAAKGKPLAWLLMMARSRAIDRLRSQHKAVPLCGIEDVEDGLADLREGPEETALADERGRRVRACLAQLPPLERQKLALAFFRGLSQSEIAQYCGMPLGTVKTYIRTGMARLSKLLDEQAGQGL
jgi:RNA polymerase sigma-70 factor (ECF subfamily)